MSTDDVYEHLTTLASNATAGEKVPSVRTLMKKFGRSQLLIERSLSQLKNEGLIHAEGGRGTFFVGKSEPSSKSASVSGRTVLIVRRSVSIKQGPIVLENLRERLSLEGHRILEVSYTDADHARTVLKTIPRFDSCIIQNSFEPLTIDTLAAIKRKAGSILFHGLGVTGSEVDCVGHEWGGAVGQALSILREMGHSSIGFATTAFPNIANALGKRRFRENYRDSDMDPDQLLLEIPRLPHENYESVLAREIAARRRHNGSLPFTALIAWGVESGGRLRTYLNEIGIEQPAGLSIVLLGHPDMQHEHDNFYSIIGPTAAAQADGLHDLLHRRWDAPDAPSIISFLEPEMEMRETSLCRYSKG